jgi:acyl carrier protein
MDKSEILARTRRFITDNFTYMRPDFDLQNDQNLLAQGVIDSLGVAELLEFLQQEFAIRIPDEDITEQNLGTLDAIAAYTAARVAQGRPGGVRAASSS